MNDEQALALVSSATVELSALLEQVGALLDRVRPALAHFDCIGAELPEVEELPPLYEAAGVNDFSAVVDAFTAMLERTDDRRWLHAP